MTIPSTPAKGKTLPDIAAKYLTVPTTITMSFSLPSEIADNLTAAELHEIQKLIRMGYKAAREEIAGDVADAAHLAEQWAELRKAKAHAEYRMNNSFSANSNGEFLFPVFVVQAWQAASRALADFEATNGIGGGA